MTQEFVTLPREVVEQSIDALSNTGTQRGQQPSQFHAEGVSINALRAALDQPQANQTAMTPIAQRKLDSLLAEGYTISGYSIYHEKKHQHGFVTGAGLVGWWKPEGVEYPQQRCEQEPDWSDSKTLPSELWKNPLLSLQERLQIADGAVQWNREVAENLRARLCAAQQPQGEQEPAAWMVTSEMQDGTRSTYPMIGRFKDVQDCCDFGEPVPLIYQHPQPKREPLSKDRIREILMCNGFTIKDGEPDLKPYVYNAVRAILDAALQQPVVDQPQANQTAMTPIAQRKLDSLLAEGYTISGYSIYHEKKHQHGFVTGAGLVGWWKPEGVEYPQPKGEPSTVAFCHVGDVVVCDNDSLLRQLGVKRSDKLYLHPQDLNCKSKQALLATLWGYTKEQPKRPPLTDEEIDKIAESMPGGLEGFLKGWGWRQFARAVLENDHNIK